MVAPLKREPPGPDGDPFGPPKVNILVRCLHCGEEYDSDRIHWVTDPKWKETGGYWACGIPECDGRGFCFDIWPVDPEWRDENGNKVWFDDEEDPEGDEEALDDADAEGCEDDEDEEPSRPGDLPDTPY